MVAESHNFNPPSEEQAAAGRLTQARDAKRASIRRWLDYQDLIDGVIRDQKTPRKDLVKLIDAQAVCYEQVRLLKGLVKPGSRNVSVRELTAAEQSKRLPNRRATDYLSDAHATLVKSQQTSDPTPK